MGLGGDGGKTDLRLLPFVPSGCRGWWRGSPRRSCMSRRHRFSAIAAGAPGHSPAYTKTENTKNYFSFFFENIFLLKKNDFNSSLLSGMCAYYNW